MGASYYGVHYAEPMIRSCVVEATSKIQTKVAIIGCGFSGIMTAFFVGALVLTLGGFLIMAISRSKAKPWIIFDSEEQDEADKIKEEEKNQIGSVRKSKFF